MVLTKSWILWTIIVGCRGDMLKFSLEQLEKAWGFHNPIFKYIHSNTLNNVINFILVYDLIFYCKGTACLMTTDKLWEKGIKREET